MKITLAFGITLLALTSARAQIFRPEAVNGAVLGGIAGAVIGNNSGDLRHNAWKGAAIGAGAGLLLGEAIGNANASARNTRIDAPRDGGYVYRQSPEPAVRFGVSYGQGYYGRSGHRGYSHGNRGYGFGYSYVPSYGYYSGYGNDYPYYGTTGYYGSSSGATNGLLLGALAGGIIGNNSGSHNGWRGAAWGAGAGWLLGSIADANRRTVAYDTAPVVVQPAPAAPTAQPAAPAQPITIINNYYNTPTPMSGANSLFGR